MTKELPENLQELVDAGEVTYRGRGFEKEGVSIKVKGKEFVISNEQFNKLGGVAKIKFAAPYRKG